MYLSRLRLSSRDRAARAWLADCHDLHRAVMTGFPGVDGPDARHQLGVLFRTDIVGSELHVLVQSREAPRWAFESTSIRKDEAKTLEPLMSSFTAGGQYRFRLRANPTRRVHQRATLGGDPRDLGLDGHWHDPGALHSAARTGVARRRTAEHQEAVGKRVELTREEDRLAWLQRQGERGGFELASALVLPAIDDPGGRPYLNSRADPSPRLFSRKGRGLTFGTALFEGTLVIQDSHRFRQAFASGIGPAKAFGCGLLSLARPSP